MKLLRKALDQIHPHVQPGAKYARWYYLFEVIDSFLFTSATKTTEAPYVRDSMDLKRVMITVVFALLPCFFMAIWNTGLQANQALISITPSTNWQLSLMEWLGIVPNPTMFLSNFIHGALYFLPVWMVCNLAGAFWEILFALVRKHEINEGFLITGSIIPLILPPTIPLWQVALATSFGVVIGKEVFGGTGRNFFNPALVARAFLFFAYPAEISGNTIWTAAEGFTGATPLGEIAEYGIAAVYSHITWMEAFLGTIPGSMGETSTLACLFGAVVLIISGVGSWRIMLSVLIGAFSLSTLFYYFSNTSNLIFHIHPMWHFVLGGFAFGTVFMATDPVSATQTYRGQWIYGFLIGMMVILIRVVNPAFPEGMMLAILFGNMCAPLIDHYVIQAHIKKRKLRYVQR